MCGRIVGAAEIPAAFFCSDFQLHYRTELHFASDDF
jgi:hypothetical protein